MAFLIPYVLTALVVAGHTLPSPTNDGANRCLHSCLQKPPCNAVAYYPLLEKCVFKNDGLTSEEPMADFHPFAPSDKPSILVTGNREVIDISGMKLFTGDRIYLIADNNRYLKRWTNGFEYITAMQPYQENRDLFTVFVKSENQMHLRADNRKYLYTTCVGNPNRPYPFCTVFPDCNSILATGSYDPNGYPHGIFTVVPVPDPTLPKTKLQDDLNNYLNKGSGGCTGLTPDGSHSSNVFTVVKSTPDIQVPDKVLDIYFHDSNMNIDRRQITVDTITFRNPSPETQRKQLGFDQTMDTRKFFTWEPGFDMSPSVSFEVRVPIGETGNNIGSGDVRFSAGGSKSENDTTRYVVSNQPIDVPACMEMVAVATVNEAKITVPYTATIERTISEGYGSQNTYKLDVDGTYTGVNQYNYHLDILSKYIC